MIHPRRGDIVLSREKTIFSALVRWQTKSHWSHAGIYDHDNLVISAVPFRGVSRTRLSDTDAWAIYRVTDVDDDLSESVADVATTFLGYRYDFAQAFLVFWRLITGTLETAVGDPAPHRFICSEMVAEVFAHVGVHFGRIPDNVLPRTIEESPRTIQIASSDLPPAKIL